jgi:hypothetical protein
MVADYQGGRHQGGVNRFASTMTSQGQKRRFGPRPPTVCLSFHCRHHPALPRTAARGHFRTHAPHNHGRLGADRMMAYLDEAR